jgi:hypothetical protein
MEVPTRFAKRWQKEVVLMGKKGFAVDRQPMTCSITHTSTDLTLPPISFLLEYQNGQFTMFEAPFFTFTQSDATTPAIRIPASKFTSKCFRIHNFIAVKLNVHSLRQAMAGAQQSK